LVIVSSGFTGVNDTRNLQRNGDSNPKHISTSHDERQNVTMRMSIRRFSRPTNGFSKTPRSYGGNLLPVLQLRPYPSDTRVMPAKEGGIADHVWSIEEIVSLF
jgi:hypothetical protein